MEASRDARPIRGAGPFAETWRSGISDIRRLVASTSCRIPVFIALRDGERESIDVDGRVYLVGDFCHPKVRHRRNRARPASSASSFTDPAAG